MRACAFLLLNFFLDPSNFFIHSIKCFNCLHISHCVHFKFLNFSFSFFCSFKKQVEDAKGNGDDDDNNDISDTSELKPRVFFG